MGNTDWSAHLGLPSQEQLKKSLDLEYDEDRYELLDIVESYKQGKDIKGKKSKLEKLVLARDEDKMVRSCLLGIIYEKEGDSEKTKKEIEKIIEIYPDDEDFKKIYKDIVNEQQRKRQYQIRRKFFWWVTTPLLIGSILVCGASIVVQYLRYRETKARVEKFQNTPIHVHLQDAEMQVNPRQIEDEVYVSCFVPGKGLESIIVYRDDKKIIEEKFEPGEYEYPNNPIGIYWEQFKEKEKLEPGKYDYRIVRKDFSGKEEEAKNVLEVKEAE